MISKFVTMVLLLPQSSGWVSILTRRGRRAAATAAGSACSTAVVRAFAIEPQITSTTRPLRSSISSSSSSSSGGITKPRTSPTTTSTATGDQSAFSKSRAPFRMPRKSPDDSKVLLVQHKQQQQSPSSEFNDSATASLAWNQLGLWTELTDCLTQDMQLEAPTAVQQFVLPELLLLHNHNPSNDNNKNDKTLPSMPKQHHVAFLAATGSGKTLAYALPLMQWLKHEEVFLVQPQPQPPQEVQNSNSNTTASATLFRPTGRPRAIVLAPTRELAYQIKSVLKLLTHRIKLSVQCVVGGEKMGPQQKLLQTRPVDILVATPGRLWKHMQASNIVLNQRHLRFVVLDEMDTMLEQGFAADLQQILYPVLYHTTTTTSNSKPPNPIDLVAGAPSVWMTSATLTQSIQKMIGDDNVNDNMVHAKRHFVKRDRAAESDQAAPNNRLLGQLPPQQYQHLQQQQQQNHRPLMVLPKMKVLKAPGLHKTVPRLQQVFVDTANVDKLSLLMDVLSSSSSHNNPRKKTSSGASTPKTMVFCNTAAACRAVEYALNEARIGGGGGSDNDDDLTTSGCLSYHGDMPSDRRMDHLQQFRENPQRNILVCTDLAARGLDVPAVDHVVMFDFPLNSLDYLHRCGRTARGVAQAGKSAKVTALVTKRDKVLANAIERAVVRGEPLDGLSSRKTDYLPGGRLDGFHNKSNNYKTNTPFKSSSSSSSTTGKNASSTSRRSGPSSAWSKKKTTMTTTRSSKPKPVDTTARKKRSSSR